jgi:hypothetical protein
MSAYIMDHMIPTVRVLAARVMVKAFKPSLGGAAAAMTGGFYTEGGNAYEDTTAEEEVRMGGKLRGEGEMGRIQARTSIRIKHL